jgi:DNA-binding CsgD family transcriptional regulator
MTVPLEAVASEPVSTGTRALYTVMPDVSRALARRDKPAALALLRTVLPARLASDALVTLAREEEQRPSPPDPRWVLTATEIKTVRAAAHGLTADETAAREGVPVNTVRSRRRSVIQKLEAANIVEAVAEAHRRGILS